MLCTSRHSLGRLFLSQKIIAVVSPSNALRYSRSTTRSSEVFRPLFKACGPFTDRQIELAETFADQAVIAIRMRGGYSRPSSSALPSLPESLEQQTATSEVLQVIASSPAHLAAGVPHDMLEKAVRICNAKSGIIYRWDGDALSRGGV